MLSPLHCSHCWAIFVGVLFIISCAGSDESRVLDCQPSASPSLSILRPDKTTVLEVEPHGMEMVAFEVEVLVCNFDATDGSLAVFGTGGETKLMDVWPPLRGRRKFNVELPFPGETMRETVEILQGGNPIVYEVEFSLLDSGFEIGVTDMMTLYLISTHIPRAEPGGISFHDEKPFVYLLSTKAEVVRPDLESDKSDVLQLIWGKTAPTLPNAVWYPGCTWNEARNRLYEEVKRRGRHYRYLIFTDDDSSLSLRPASADFEQGTWDGLDDPWREFERLLVLWQPAAGYARYTIQQPQETKREEKEVECVRFADPLLVAYHFEAAAFLLPYTTHFDQESWWYSAVVVNNLAGVYFPGHVIQFNTIYVHDNQKSAGYAAFRQMNWERPMRWLLSAAISPEQVSEFGLLNPIQVKCNATLHQRERPYVVPAADFDKCHPAFAHLRLPGMATSVRNCSGWSQEGKLFDLLFLRTEKMLVAQREEEEAVGREQREGDGRRAGEGGRERELEEEVEALQRRVAVLEKGGGCSEGESGKEHCEATAGEQSEGSDRERVALLEEKIEALEQMMQHVIQLVPAQ